MSPTSDTHLVTTQRAAPAETARFWERQELVLVPSSYRDSNPRCGTNVVSTTPPKERIMQRGLIISAVALAAVGLAAAPAVAGLAGNPSFSRQLPVGERDARGGRGRLPAQGLRSGRAARRRARCRTGPCTARPARGGTAP